MKPGPQDYDGLQTVVTEEQHWYNHSRRSDTADQVHNVTVREVAADMVDNAMKVQDRIRKAEKQTYEVVNETPDMAETRSSSQFHWVTKTAAPGIERLVASLCVRRIARTRRYGLLLSAVCNARQCARWCIYESRERLYAGRRQSSIAIVVSIVMVPSRGSLLSRERKDVDQLCRNAPTDETCSNGCTGSLTCFCEGIDKGFSGPCRFFQIVGSAIVIFVKLRGEVRKRDNDYSCSSEGNMLSVPLKTKSFTESCWSRTREGRIESSCSMDVPILQPWAVT
jgi:hypothetical protein